MTQRITTHLVFESRAEDAVDFYLSILGGKVLSTTRFGEDSPGEEGAVAVIRFEMLGQTYWAVNGGDEFSFTEGISLYVSCDTQTEIDDLWARLSDGGSTSVCGWLTDRFGVSWQVAPAIIEKILDEADAETIDRVNRVIWSSEKLEVGEIRAAAGGAFAN